MIKVKDGYAKLIGTTYSGSADRVLLSNGGDFSIHTGRNNEVNKLVRTDGSGYIQAGWINTTSGNFTGTPDRIYASNDGYIRYMTPANFRANVIGNNYWKVNAQTTAGTGDIYLEMWRGTNASWKMLNTGGILKFQSNYTSAAGSYFDVLNLEYNSGNGWLKGYLTSAGFIKNGSSSAYALTGDGGHKQWSTSSTANTLVARDANQYIYATYYNSNIGNEDGITIGSVYVRNNSDNWIRRMSYSKFVENITNSIDSRYIKTHDMMNSACAIIPTYNGETGWHRIATINGSAGYGSYILYLCGNWSYASNTNAIIHIDTMHTTAQLTQVSGIVGYVSSVRLVNISNNQYYVDVYINYSGANTPGTVYCYFLGNGAITPRTTAEKITASVTAAAEIALQSGGRANNIVVNNSDSNSTYRMVWHSGSTLYSTAGIYCNPSTDYLYATSMNASDWFRSSGTTGWYNPTNNCHVYPNAATTYGGLMLRGEKGGYTGFILGTSTNYMNLMDNGTDKGLYQEGKGWILYYNRSNNYVGIRTSSLSDPLTVAGITRIVASDKYLRIGPQNSSHAHYETNATVSHWFNKTVQVDGNVEPYGNNEHSSGSSSNRWSNVYSYLGNFAGPVTITYNSYPGLTIHNNTTSGEASIYLKNNTAGWALGVNPWSKGAGVFGIGQYQGTGSSNCRLSIDNNGKVRIGTDSGSEMLNVGGWVGTVGNTGWYSVTHTGGWYMSDATYIRVYGSKRVYNDNTSQYAFYTAGGMTALGHMYSNSAACSWLAGQNATNAALNIGDATDTGSYWPWLRQANTSSKKWFSVGTLNNSLYFIGSTTSKTDNSYDYGFRMDFSNGYFYGNFSGYLSGTASNVTVNDSNADSTYRIVWHSGNTLYGTNNIYCNPSADQIYSAGFRHVSYNSASYLLRSDGGAAAFNWSAQSGQPTYVWGGNSQHTYYVYNPSNFSVLKSNKTDQLEAYTSSDFTGGNHFVRAIRYDSWHTRLYMGYYRDTTLQNTVHVGYADNATNSTNATNASYLNIHDVRNATRLPDYFTGKKVTAWFNNTGTPDGNWYSGLHVKGWDTGYTSWELCSYSSTGTANDYNLFFRNGNNSTWGSWKYIPTSSTAAKGSATNGVYISGGKFNAMTYSLSATVNSGTASKIAYYSGANAISCYTSSKGSTTKGMYLNAGVPTEMTYSLNATVNSGTASRLAYYSSATAISGLAISASTSTLYIVGVLSGGHIPYSATQSTTSGVSIRSGNTVYAAGGFYESSDERLKTFLTDVTVDLEKLRKLPKKYFKWCSNTMPQGIQLGTSAQAVQEIYPELVTTNELGYLHVAYDKLSIVALKAIDTLYDMVLDIKKENELLKARIEYLENKL